MSCPLFFIRCVHPMCSQFLSDDQWNFCIQQVLSSIKIRMLKHSLKIYQMTDPRSLHLIWLSDRSFWLSDVLYTCEVFETFSLIIEHPILWCECPKSSAIITFICFKSFPQSFRLDTCFECFLTWIH